MDIKYNGKTYTIDPNEDIVIRDNNIIYANRVPAPGAEVVNVENDTDGCD